MYEMRLLCKFQSIIVCESWENYIKMLAGQNMDKLWNQITHRKTIEQKNLCNKILKNELDQRM